MSFFASLRRSFDSRRKRTRPFAHAVRLSLMDARAYLERLDTAGRVPVTLDGLAEVTSRTT